MFMIINHGAVTITLTSYCLKACAFAIRLPHTLFFCVSVCLCVSVRACVFGAVDPCWSKDTSNTMTPASARFNDKLQRLMGTTNQSLLGARTKCALNFPSRELLLLTLMLLTANFTITK